MGMKIWKDSTCFEWNVNITAFVIRQALKEMNCDLRTSLDTKQEEFLMALFWYSIQEQAGRNGLTRNQVENDFLQPEDLFLGGNFMNFMVDQVNEIVMKNFKKDEKENPQKEASL